MKLKFKHNYKNYRLCILFIVLCILILLYYFLKVKKENFQSFLQKQIDITNLKSKLKSFSKSNGPDKCLAKIDCYNKLIFNIYDEFLNGLFAQVNPDSILTKTFGEDNKSGIIKLLSDIKNTKNITKNTIESVNETSLSILLELANNLTKITNNDTINNLKKELFYKYELILNDILPKNLVQINTTEFISNHYQESTPETTVNYDSLMMASKNRHKGTKKKAPDIYSIDYQTKKIKKIKDFFFVDFKDYFKTTKIISVKTVAKINLFDVTKFKQQLDSIFESYKDVTKVNSKIQKIKKELDAISSDTENWYCQNKNICVNS
jgi:hypothetical protein